MLPAATGAPLPWWFPASAAFWRHGDVTSEACPCSGDKALSFWACRALPAPMRRWLPAGGAAYERVQGNGYEGDLGSEGAEVNGEAGAGGDGRHVEAHSADEDARDAEEQAAAPAAARLSGLWKARHPALLASEPLHLNLGFQPSPERPVEGAPPSAVVRCGFAMPFPGHQWLH